MNPVRKDTFVVPNKGYIILRFYTDNLGKKHFISIRRNVDRDEPATSTYIYIVNLWT